MLLNFRIEKIINFPYMPQFNPAINPEEMTDAGVFGGRGKLGKIHRTPEKNNYFGVLGDHLSYNLEIKEHVFNRPSFMNITGSHEVVNEWLKWYQELYKNPIKTRSKFNREVADPFFTTFWRIAVKKVYADHEQIVLDDIRDPKALITAQTLLELGWNYNYKPSF